MRSILLNHRDTATKVFKIHCLVDISTFNRERINARNLLYIKLYLSREAAPSAAFEGTQHVITMKEIYSYVLTLSAPTISFDNGWRVDSQQFIRRFVDLSERWQQQVRTISRFLPYVPFVHCNQHHGACKSACMTCPRLAWITFMSCLFYYLITQ